MCSGHDICDTCVTVVNAEGVERPIGLPLDHWTGKTYPQEDGARMILATALVDVRLGTYEAWPELKVAMENTVEKNGAPAYYSVAGYAAGPVKRLIRSGLAYQPGMDGIRATIIAEVAVMESERRQMIALHEQIFELQDNAVSRLKHWAKLAREARAMQVDLDYPSAIGRYALTGILSGNPVKAGRDVWWENIQKLIQLYPAFATQEVRAKLDGTNPEKVMLNKKAERRAYERTKQWLLKQARRYIGQNGLMAKYDPVAKIRGEQAAEKTLEKVILPAEIEALAIQAVAKRAAYRALGDGGGAAHVAAGELVAA